MTGNLNGVPVCLSARAWNGGATGRMTEIQLQKACAMEDSNKQPVSGDVQPCHFQYSWASFLTKAKA